MSAKSIDSTLEWREGDPAASGWGARGYNELNAVSHDGRRRHLDPCPPRTSDRHVESLGPDERDAFWKPADQGWPVYWWRADIAMWVCAPTITASIQTYATVREDGRVHRRGGFDELTVTPR